MSGYNFNVIQNILCETAEAEIRRSIKSGVSMEDAINSAKDKFELSEEEMEQIDGNLNSQDKKLETPENKNLKENTIYFPLQEDQDNAVGMLMYKGIPWAEKGIDESGKPFIQFANESDINSARELMKKKWDFIDNKDKAVANILFDNLNDYTKVMEFIKKNKMLVDFEDKEDLDEDADIVDAMNAKQKVTAKRSFRARRKDVKEDNFAPEKSKSFRNAIIRKRWK